jgi:hypothetical protein
VRATKPLKLGLSLVIVALALGVGAPAWANTTISINPGNVPTTAAAFAHECNPSQGGGPFPGQDVWVFVLPGTHETSGDFASVTANFGAGGTVTITVGGNPGNFSNGGPATSKAWVIAPAGFTLVGATAEITGTAASFNLTHTCPASGSPCPSASGTETPSPSPSATESPSPAPSPSPSPPASPSVTGPASPSAPQSPAITAVPCGAVPAGGGGSQSSGSLVWGLGTLTAATGAAAALVLLRRRRVHV